MERTLRKILSMGIKAAKVTRKQAEVCLKECTGLGLLSAKEGVQIMKDVYAEAKTEGIKVARYARKEAMSELHKAKEYTTKKMSRGKRPAGARKKR